MQVVWAAFSGMLWLQSCDNSSGPAGLSISGHAYTWSSKLAYPGTTGCILLGSPAPHVQPVLHCSPSCSALILCSTFLQSTAGGIKRVTDQRLDAALFVLPKSAGVEHQVES